jgi:hypothetical protein
MNKYIVLYGSASKPELSDEIKGYLDSAEDAQKYCDHKNQFAKADYAYYYEEAVSLAHVWVDPPTK